MTKYCKYHQNNGHTTDEYKALQDKIEELIRTDHCCCFVRKDGPSHPRQSDNRHPPHDTRHPNRPNTNDHPDHQPAYTNVNQVDPPYVAQSTLSLGTSLAVIQPHQLGRNTFALSNPSTTQLTSTTDAECPPSPSLTPISMVSINNKMILWSSPSNLRTSRSKRCSYTKTIQLISFTGPPTKISNFPPLQ